MLYSCLPSRLLMSHSLVGYMYPFLKYTMFLGQILVGHQSNQADARQSRDEAEAGRFDAGDLQAQAGNLR